MNNMPHKWAVVAHNKLVSKLKKRLLRTYKRVASLEHSSCWKCTFDIHPGDEYEAEVWLITNPPWLPERETVIEVRKTHVYCPKDPWDEEIRKKIEEESKEHLMMVDKVA